MDPNQHINNSCKSKKRYMFLDNANDMGKLSMIDIQGKTIGPQLYIYHCVYCKGFHLTQQKTDIKVF